MSVVIDGKDILEHSEVLAIGMRESLDSILNGKEGKIPPGLLYAANRLFSTGIEGVKLSRGSPPNPGDLREFITTYRMLKDMLRKTRQIPEKDLDSELEKIAEAVKALEPEGGQIVFDRETYTTLKDLFGAIYEEGAKYCGELGQHSPYSIGTFDDD